MCKATWVKGLITILLLSFTGILMAQSASDSTSSLGDIADNLMGPTGIVTKLVDIACYIIGIVFILLSFAQYKIHLQSPKLVPLTTPIMLLLLGIVAVLIPYVTTLTKTGKTEQGQQQQESKESFLPLPDVNREKGLPLPPPTEPYKREDQPGSTNPPPDSGSGSSGGGRHWTQDPRYQ